jgi:type I restriction enzyme S subunit
MKIDKSKWTEVEFGHVVDHIENNDRNTESRCAAKYVSVKNLETLDLRIKGYSKEEQPSFSRIFKKGQILFAKRRAYQKKVAIADFDGICSPHLWALETKGDLTQELLPFIMQKDAFYEYVNANSAGTMSTYLKWPALSKYKLKVPTNSDQKNISALFLSLESLINKTEEQFETLKKLSLKIVSDLTNEQPKFGKLIEQKDLISCKLNNVATEYSKREDNPIESTHERFIGSDCIDRFDFKIKKWDSTKNIISSMKVFESGDYLLVRRSLYASDFRERAPRADFEGLCSGDILTIREKADTIEDGYLLVLLNAPNLWAYIVANASGSITRRVKWKDLAEYSIQLPKPEIQRLIVNSIREIENLKEKMLIQRTTLIDLKHQLLDEILG